MEPCRLKQYWRLSYMAGALQQMVYRFHIANTLSLHASPSILRLYNIVVIVMVKNTIVYALQQILCIEILNSKAWTVAN